MGHGVSKPPNLLEDFEAALGCLDLQRLALVTDFDGTLSEFVPDLENAVIHPDIPPSLCHLAVKLRLTAVMSGRAARDVEGRVGIKSIVYVGNHGAEQMVDGVLSVAAGVEDAESHLQDLLERLAGAADDPGLVLENKRYSASLHFRRASDEEQVVERLQYAIRTMPDLGGFEIYWGNKILEFRHRNSVNKGVALARLIDEWRPNSVIFLGDDTTDADALKVLKQRSGVGEIQGLGIAVIQDGTPASVLDSADYSLDGVPEVAAFLSRLHTAAG